MAAWKVWIQYKDGTIKVSDDCVHNQDDLNGLIIGLSYIGAAVIKVER